MTDVTDITGTEKVAAFLLSLERDDALSLMRHLDAELVASIASAMTELEDKFRSLASRAPSYGQTEAFIDAVWALEAGDDVSELMALAVPNV